MCLTSPETQAPMANRARKRLHLGRMAWIHATRWSRRSEGEPIQNRFNLQDQLYHVSFTSNVSSYYLASFNFGFPPDQAVHYEAGRLHTFSREQVLRRAGLHLVLSCVRSLQMAKNLKLHFTHVVLPFTHKLTIL